MSTPFRNKLFTFTQPDGTEFEVIGNGDQHHAVFETLDGHTVVKDPTTGFYQFAILSVDGEELEASGARVDRFDAQALNLTPHVRASSASVRGLAEERFRLMTGGRRCEQRCEHHRQQARAAGTDGLVAAPPSRGTIGDISGLCLLVDFSDDEATITQQEVADFCNQEGYSANGNNGSVRDYFHDNSGGMLTYTNVVTAYYRARQPKSHYTDPSIQYGVRARQLIKEALDQLSNQGFNFAQLSADSDGFIYALNIFYAGAVQNNWSEGLWPHAWNLAAAYDVGSGKQLFDYQFTAMGNELELGTFCHENGHMVCDYPDLYDKSGFKSQGAGKYCLMAGGGHGKNPSQISAYLKYKSGWSNSLVPVTHGAQITLSSDQNDFAIHKKNDTEYFIIENRNKTGRDSDLPDAGLTIWHVDELGNNSDEQMTPAQHFELSLEQADNDFDLEKGRNRGDSGDLFDAGGVDEFSDTTSPDSKWWDGTASDLRVRSIGAIGRGISFETSLHEDEVVERRFEATSEPEIPIPDMNPIGIIDTIRIEEGGSIASFNVSVNIKHTYRGDLRVTLHTPYATSIVLHKRHLGGSTDDIDEVYDTFSIPVLSSVVGKSLTGDWTLQVQDLAFVDTGTLLSWGIAGEVVGASDVVLEEFPGTRIPDNDAFGIEREMECVERGAISSLEVSVDITHTFIRDLTVTLASPAGITIHLHNRSGGSADDIVKTFTPATTPALASLIGESVEGKWKLRVSDHEGLDKGKLNMWRLKLVR